MQEEMEANVRVKKSEGEARDRRKLGCAFQLLCTAFIQQRSCKFSLTSQYALAALLSTPE